MRKYDYKNELSKKKITVTSSFNKNKIFLFVLKNLVKNTNIGLTTLLLYVSV